MMNETDLPELSHDDWYGGRLTLTQPAQGFRANLDAILLAAAIPATAQYVLELGAGVGGCALALAARLPMTRVLAVERDPVMAALLARNIADNELTERVTAMTADALGPKPDWAARHDVVMINPPYNDPLSTLSEDVWRKEAMAGGDLSAWIDAAARGLAAKGRVVMISRADRLDELMAGMAGRFGDISIRAIHTSADMPAKRVLISGRLGVDGPVAILPALMGVGDAGYDGDVIEMIAPGRDLARVRLVE